MTDQMPTSFSSPESKTIKAGCYDPVTEQMEVEFQSGKTYIYSGILPDLWIDFEAAASKGTFFGKRIRPLYAGKLKE